LLLCVSHIYLAVGANETVQTPHRTASEEVQRSSKISASLLLATSILVVFGVYIYQRTFARLDEYEEQTLERLKTTDRTLKQILLNFSIQHLEDNKFRGITPKIHTASLSFRDINCKVMTGCEERSILESITGTFQAYHLSAIMGPSGCGKSTLLDVLTGKKKTDGKWTVEGDILINEKKTSIEDIKPVIGFVPQDDVVHEGLTVRENIYYSAAKRMPRGTRASRLRAITNDVLQVLQLESRQNLLVGNRVRTGEGLSGGQKKRVNVGIELAACPTILFLDEPTSGLDATASLMIVQQLKRMARLGVTIVMVIHQPRYDLFTLLDDVLLLGTLEDKGGRMAYMGPTVQAKSHFEHLGLQMPENWNPADWMMDILSGQNLDQQNCRIPVSDLPAALFKKWQDSPTPEGEAPPRRYVRALSGDTSAEVEIIKQHCKECWSEVAPGHSKLDAEDFAKVLRACTGATPDEEIIEEIMYRASTYDVRGESTLGHPPTFLFGEFGGRSSDQAGERSSSYITLRAFVTYLLSFRGVEREDIRLGSLAGLSGMSAPLQGMEESSDETVDELTDSDSSTGQASDQDMNLPMSSTTTTLVSTDLKRTMPGCCGHFRYTLRTSLLTFWRTMGIKIFFLGVMCFAAAFLSVMDAIIFNSPPWSATSFLNAQIALALLIAVYSLQLFSNDQEMYWREASHGLNRFAFFAGRALVNTFDWLLLTFFFLLVYFSIARPIVAFEEYIWPFFLVSYVASGWGYALSCCLPVELGAFISSILMFMMGGILGLPMQMADFLNGGFFEIVVSSISFTRWSVSMSFLEYVTAYPPDPETLSQIDNYQLTKFRDAYDGAHFLLPCQDSQYWSGLLALVLQGSVLRVVAYLGLRFTNRARQI